MRLDYNAVMESLDELSNPVVFLTRWRAVEDSSIAFGEVIERLFTDSGLSRYLDEREAKPEGPFEVATGGLSSAIDMLDLSEPFESFVGSAAYDNVRDHARRLIDVIDKVDRVGSESPFSNGIHPYGIDSLPRVLVGPTPTSEDMLDPVIQSLPMRHREILMVSNGFTAGLGRTRFLGIRPELEVLDLKHWNEFSTWKFAWGKRMIGFLVFALDHWGTQYAYRCQSSGEKQEDSVYTLDSRTMEIASVCDSFDDFWVDLVDRNTRPRSRLDGIDLSLYMSSGAMNASYMWCVGPGAKVRPTLGRAFSPMLVDQAMILAGKMDEEMRKWNYGKVPSLVEHVESPDGAPGLRVEFDEG